MNFEHLVARIKEEEGFSPVSYWDNDQYTFGYGTEAPGPNATITEGMADIVLRKRLRQAVEDYRTIFNGAGTEINEVRQEALVDMCFNLGRTKMAKFKDMIADINDDDPNDWAEVAAHAKDSLWHRQVKDRAVRIELELASGKSCA